MTYNHEQFIDKLNKVNIDNEVVDKGNNTVFVYRAIPDEDPDISYFDNEQREKYERGVFEMMVIIVDVYYMGVKIGFELLGGCEVFNRQDFLDHANEIDKDVDVATMRFHYVMDLTKQIVAVLNDGDHIVIENSDGEKATWTKTKSSTSISL